MALFYGLWQHWENSRTTLKCKGFFFFHCKCICERIRRLLCVNVHLWYKNGTVPILQRPDT